MRRAETCKVFILAGGEGTRLRPLTLTRPKSMIPLGPKPVIEHLITQMSRSGFTDFIITVNYLKEQILHYLGDGSRFGIRVEYAIEPESIFLGTAGGVKLASHLLNETFMVLQGDAFTTIDLAGALDFHRRSEADATIILKEVSDPWLYGVVLRDSEGKVTAFQEKPRKGEELSNLISTGMYCLEPEVLDLITPGECDFAKDVFPKLLSEGKRLFGFVGKGFWVDIGSLTGYLEGTKQILETQIKEQDSQPRENALIGRNVVIDETASIRGPVLIEDDVLIDKDSTIGPCVVLKNGVKAGEKTVMENAVILEGVTLGSSCRICGSIVGERASLANNIFVNGSIIGPGSILEESTQAKNGSRVWPGIRVPPNTSVEGMVVLPTNRPFYFHSGIGKYTGVTASTIIELANALQTVEIESVEFHFYRRDFERWIREVFQANMLAEMMSSLRKKNLKGEELRKKLIDAIKAWYEYTTELQQWNENF